MREQVENYNIVSFPLPDWMQPEADRYGDYISAYIFQKGIQLPKAARAYITFLEQFYGPDSGYEEECSENKTCRIVSLKSAGSPLLHTGRNFLN